MARTNRTRCLVERAEVRRYVKMLGRTRNTRTHDVHLRYSSYQARYTALRMDSSTVLTALAACGMIDRKELYTEMLRRTGRDKHHIEARKNHTTHNADPVQAMLPDSIPGILFSSVRSIEDGLEHPMDVSYDTGNCSVGKNNTPRCFGEQEKTSIASRRGRTAGRPTWICTSDLARLCAKHQG